MKKAQLIEFLHIPRQYIKGPQMPKFVISSDDCEFIDTCEFFKGWMKDSTVFTVVVSNFGWRKVTFETEIEITKPEHFMTYILPKTECSWKVYKKSDILFINNFHHDSPTGEEWYVIKKTKKSKAC